MLPEREPRSLLSLTQLVATFGDPETDLDISGVLSAICHVVDADSVVLCGSRTVTEAVGFDGLIRPDRELLALARSGVEDAELSGLGRVSVARSEISGTAGSVVVLRAGGPFTDDEVILVTTIGRILGLAATMRLAVEAELGGGGVSLRLIDVEAPDNLVIVSSHGFEPEQVDAMRVVSVGAGCMGRAIRESRLVVDPDEGEDRTPGAMMIAPVAVGGEVVGCLTVSTGRPEQSFSPPEQEALLALAQHASLALQDARSTDAMHNALDRERHRAEHDPLTGLPNRPTIRAALSHRIGIADKVPIVLLFVDLDRFKLTNDTLGHSFGDTVLTVVADRLRTSVRATDVVGRLSGDEFVVICEGITEVGAIEFAQRLQTVISEPITEGHIAHVVTASVGVARAHRGESAQQVLANADLAMYRAKENGRGGVEVFDDALRDQVEERMLVSQDLRRALEEDELRVYLQPVVELPSRRVAGFEALARWEHPTRGLLTPAAFVPLAEDTGQISGIDRFVLEQTIGLLGAHPGSRPISVNVSARTVSDSGLAAWISDQLQKADVDPSLLIIEVTETLLMDHKSAASGQLEAMRDLGLRIIIDDFGTGYSSLAYLQTFDVDGVKIDRGFIGRLGNDPRAEAIVAAVFSMAAALDLLVVAEGIETDEQVDQMVAIRDKEGGIELLGQGYLFGRPADGTTRMAGFIEVPMVSPIAP